MPLLCEVYAVVGQGNVPRSGIGKADAHSLRQGLTELGEGMGVINELLIRHPCPQGYRRRCDQEDLLSIQGDAGEESLHPFSGLLWAPALEQIIGSQHDDQRICVIREGGGRGGDLPTVLPHIGDCPSCLRGQDIHPPAVRIITPAEIAPGIIAVGVGVTKADDLHRPISFLCR